MTTITTGDPERDLRRFQTAFATRTFEIDLLWKRSQIFWAFNVTAFIGFSLAADGHHGIALIVANFGLFTSFCWMLLNRSSKYWFEVWEIRAERTAEAVIGDLLMDGSEPPMHGWLGARRYSPSRLLIAVSDYSVFLWGVALGFVLLRLAQSGTSWLSEALLLAGLTVLGALYTWLSVRHPH